MAYRSLKGTRKSSSSKWKVLKSPSLRDPSITPFELHTKDKSPFNCAEIKEFKAGSSETKPDLQIGDKECLNLDDMEPEYNPALFGGDMKDCSSVLSNGELGRTPLKEVSNLSHIRAGNKISGVEAAVNSISRAMLKHIDPKARTKGVDRKGGDVDPDTDPQSLGPSSAREEQVDGDPKPNEIMQIEAGGDVDTLAC